jgi:hypothetical protein
VSSPVEAAGTTELSLSVRTKCLFEVFRYDVVAGMEPSRSPSESKNISALATAVASALHRIARSTVEHEEQLKMQSGTFSHAWGKFALHGYTPETYNRLLWIISSESLPPIDNGVNPSSYLELVDEDEI